MKKLINRYKQFRKEKYIRNESKKKYAFIGMGMHSIQNLYPIINHLRLDLKYIVVNTQKNAALINKHFPHSRGTNDLDSVLNDTEVEGVFVSSHPHSHFSIVKRVLEVKKHVFVEKPPCLSLEELEQLIVAEKKSQRICLVGLQKNYAPCNQILKDSLKGSCTYNYKFLIGAYSEGDAFMDLFIHPIALCYFLFGQTVSVKVTDASSNRTTTTFLHLKHSNGTVGSIELSTNYSWRTPQEELVINAPRGIYKMRDTEQLVFEPKKGMILGMPKEKIFKSNFRKEYLFDRNNFNPILENNQLFSAGYYNEIKAFVDLCELQKINNHSSLTSCESTYSLIKKIKENSHV